MALGDNYATTAELKSEFGIGDTDDDTELDLALTAATAWVTSHCGRDFNQITVGAETARVFYPATSSLVRVDDIAGTTNLVVKTDTSDNGTYDTTWSATDYQLEPLNQTYNGLLSWPYMAIRAVESKFYPVSSRRAPIEVTAQWGWPSVPKPVKKATLIQAARLYKRRDSAEGVMAGFGDFGPVRVGVRLDPDVEALLAPYRKFPVPVA